MPAKKRSPAQKLRKPAPAAPEAALFDRVAGIIEQAQSSVVRAVNSSMVLAYWLIGREIVREIQGEENRAEYGKRLLESLARDLSNRYGPGFSATSLKYFRTFYLAYRNRLPQTGPPAGDVSAPSSIGRPRGDLLETGGESALQNPQEVQPPTGFSPQLTWSHYRALMRVPKREVRDFYEQEAIAGGWNKRTLERQIQSFYYERMLKSQNPADLLKAGRQTLTGTEPAVETLKNPYVLEFLGLPEVASLNESELEAAILTSLQAFLMELGKGFAFVGRQKRLRCEDTDRYVDLVFYHIPSRFYLLIDLKLGELTHADVGQMDGYVRIFDDLCLSEGDNPTIGLILCTEKSETVARYSVLNDRRQIFASRYTLFLPTEEELQREIERERRLIEDRIPPKLTVTRKNH